jgi:hypothetical protein
MSEPFVGSETSEELEGTEERSQKMQELDNITNEPESYVEAKINVAQSEAIESSFNQLVNTAQETHQGEMKALPLPIPMPVEADEVSCDPIPMPSPATEVDSSSTEGVGDDSVPAAEDDWESPNVHEAINPDPIYRETDDASINPGPLFNETGEMASSPSEGTGEGPAPASEDDWKPPLANVAIDPRPIWREVGEIKGADESPMLTEQEPTPLLTDNEIIAIQKQLETNTKDFIIVTVLTGSTGSAEKNAISNIR